MIKWIRRLVKIAVLLIAVALILDLHYQGKSARQYAKEYGEKGVQWVYRTYKNLVGKDLEDLTPKSLSDIPAKIKQLGSETENKNSPPALKKEVLQENPSQKQQGSSGSPDDGITHEDREKLKQLLEQKSK
jgi:hypothetical protein